MAGRNQPRGKVLLVGQAFGPSLGARKGRELAPKTAARLALTGKVGRKLADLAGLSYHDYLQAFDRRNLLNYYPGPAKVGEGDSFLVAEAKTAAVRMRPQLAGRVVILLGASVAEAFGYGKVPLTEWTRCYAWGAEFLMAKVPHPSGVNRWWNDYENVRRVEMFLRVFLRPRGDSGQAS